MRILSFRSVGICLLSFLIFNFCPRAARAFQLELLEEVRVSMACTFSIAAYGADSGRLSRAAVAAFDEIDRIDRLMSNYKRNSPLSILNRAASGRPAVVEPELFQFIQECVRYSRDSGGAFDVTVGPLMKAWGFFHGEGSFPTAAALSAARRRVGYRLLILDVVNKTIQFAQPGMELDLGGIAKGYAVDRAVQVLKSHGIESAMVSAGGSTVYGLGSPPGSKGWEVGISDPLDSKKNRDTVILRNRALSISGSSEKSFQRHAVTYSHVMDPRTGQPVQNVLGVAVLADTGTAGDALDNIFYVLGPDASARYLRKVATVEVIFFLPAAKGTWKSIRLKNPQ